MRFYIIGEFGRIEEKVWCDNPNCPYHDGRGGIPTEQIVLSRGDKDYCCKECEQQAHSSPRQK